MQKLRVFKALKNIKYGKCTYLECKLYYGSDNGSKLCKNYVGNVRMYTDADNYTETCSYSDAKLYLSMLNRKIFFKEIGYVLVKSKRDKRRILNGEITPIVITKLNKIEGEH